MFDTLQLICPGWELSKNFVGGGGAAAHAVSRDVPPVILECGAPDPNPEQIAAALFTRVLGRPPAPADLSAWAEEVRRLRGKGVADDEILVGLAGQLQQSWGYLARLRGRLHLLGIPEDRIYEYARIQERIAAIDSRVLSVLEEQATAPGSRDVGSTRRGIRDLLAMKRDLLREREAVLRDAVAAGRKEWAGP